MKTSVLIRGMLAVSLLLLFPFSRLEAQVVDAKPTIVGVWQKAMYQQGYPLPTVRYMPIFKFLNEDGSFYQMDTHNRKAFIIHVGTFDIKSDTSYVEHITKSPYRGFTGRHSEVKYHLDPTGKTLTTEWYNTETKAWEPEMYIRIEAPEFKDIAH